MALRISHMLALQKRRNYPRIRLLPLSATLICWKLIPTYEQMNLMQGRKLMKVLMKRKWTHANMP